MGKYTDVFTPVGVTGGLHLRYNDPMTKKKNILHTCTKNSLLLSKHIERNVKG